MTFPMARPSAACPRSRSARGRHRSHRVFAGEGFGMGTYANRLLQGTHKVAVWGAGYIGFSTLAYFARRGVGGIAVDVRPARVDAINRGDLEVVGLADWLGFDVKPLTARGLIRATTDPR